MKNEKNKKMTRDLTVGNPALCILSFQIPMFLGMLFQQLYSMVDAVIVGKFLGLLPLAGIGATGSICFLIIGFCNGLSNGFAIPVAQMFGAKKYTELRKFVANTIWMGAFFAVVISVATVILCKPILRLLSTPSDIFEYSYIYLVILFAAIPFTILYNSAAAVLRALGDSKSPVIFLAFSSFINIALDVLFISFIGMGVEGAAIATMISQAVSGVACVIYMYKKFEILHITKDEWRFERSYSNKLCYIGVPMGLQYSITAIGTMVIQKAVNDCGSLAVAGMTAAQKINGIITCPIEALASTMATYVGQNVGAKKIDRIGKGLTAANIMGFGVSIFMFVLMIFFGKPMSMLFLEADELEALNYSYLFIVISSGFYILLTIVGNYRFSIQGMGYSDFAIIAGVLEMVARIIAGTVLAGVFGYIGVCFASPLAWIFADVFLIPAYFYSKKKIKRELGID